MEFKEDKALRFRCHTGHAYTDNALFAFMESVGGMSWQVIRSPDEAVMLLDHIGESLNNAGDSAQAKKKFH